MPWPWFNSWCGDIDICGNKKPQSFFRDVVWGQSKIELAVHEPVPAGKTEIVSYWGWPNELQSWNWQVAEGTPLEVSVYSSCQSVRLELNGKVIGEQAITDTSKLTAKFMVPYKAGELKAIGLDNGKEVASKILKTSGKAQSIVLIADRSTIKANRNELAYIAIEIVDDQGNIVPDAANTVEVTIEGQGELQAFGNASPDQPTSFKKPRCNAFRGRSLLIIRPFEKKGSITIHAKSEGLTDASTEIKTL
jgi:beta-galactosidase